MKRFTQFFELVVIADQFSEGAAVMFDFVPLALGILVMFFALFESILEAFFDLLAIDLWTFLAAFLGVFFGIILFIRQIRFGRTRFWLSHGIFRGHKRSSSGTGDE